MARRAGLLMAALLSGCAGMLAPAKTHWPSLPDGYFMHVGEFLQVSATGRAAGSSTTETRSIARDAALLNAWDRLRRYIEDLPLAGGGRVGERSTASEEYAAGIHRLVQRSRIVQTQFTSAGTAVVLIRIEKALINQALGTRFQ